MKSSTFVKVLLAGAVLFAVVTVGPRVVMGLIGSRDIPVNDPEQYAHSSLIYGRVRTVDGATYEGRLRWGNAEAFWGDYFNGVKKENRWASMVPEEQLPKVSRTVTILGIPVSEREETISTRRLFIARFGDIARITGDMLEVHVTLKSGATFDLDRNEASDFDDPVRVWDSKNGLVDLDSRRIREIELLTPPEEGPEPRRLFGIVMTKQGTFQGFVQWDRQLCLGSDDLLVKSSDGREKIRFEKIRSIERRAGDSIVTLTDGRQLSASGLLGTGDGNNGAYVDDARYGRVLVSWEQLERIDFSFQGSGPAYADFPPGGPLHGSVKTRDGRALTGRLVYDMDESEVTESLDAPAHGVDYLVPFRMIQSVDLAGAGPGVRVRLSSGEVLDLERRGDLGSNNAGLLVFADGQSKPEYLRWNEVERVDLVHP